jgi:hypothetical protein
MNCGLKSSMFSEDEVPTNKVTTGRKSSNKTEMQIN